LHRAARDKSANDRAIAQVVQQNHASSDESDVRRHPPTARELKKRKREEEQSDYAPGAAGTGDSDGDSDGGGGAYRSGQAAKRRKIKGDEADSDGEQQQNDDVGGEGGADAGAAADAVRMLAQRPTRTRTCPRAWTARQPWRCCRRSRGTRPICSLPRPPLQRPRLPLLPLRSSERLLMTMPPRTMRRVCCRCAAPRSACRRRRRRRRRSGRRCRQAKTIACLACRIRVPAAFTWATAPQAVDEVAVALQQGGIKRVSDAVALALSMHTETPVDKILGRLKRDRAAARVG
jgi:hypothetical protein